jgi:inhibitor of cysteine peptidase
MPTRFFREEYFMTLLQTFIISYFIVMNLLVTGCESSSDSLDIVLHYSDNGKTVEMNIKDRVVLYLPSNPTTGYCWEQVSPEGCILFMEGDSVFTEDSDCSGLVGCSGTEKLVFRSNTTGSGTLEMVCHRPFEENSTIKEFVISFQVK